MGGLVNLLWRPPPHQKALAPCFTVVSVSRCCTPPKHSTELAGKRQGETIVSKTHFMTDA